MGIVSYALMTYGLTIVISLLVVGIIVAVDKAVSAVGGEEHGDE